MEKKMYRLEISEDFEHVKLPLTRQEALRFTEDTVKELITLVSEGEATTKVIIEKLQRVVGIFDEMASINR